MDIGIYDNITNEEYHGGKGISKSGLDLISKSPAHFKASLDGISKREPTAAQALGTAFHTLVLEPEIFWAQYAEPIKRDDYPDALQHSDLVEMVEKLNETRLPKLSMSGSKDELVSRIITEIHANDTTDLDTFTGIKTAELKEIITQENTKRHGLIKTTGNTAELSSVLRENGCEFQLWSEIKDKYASDNSEKIILDDDKFYQLINMRDAVMAHPMAKKMLTGGKAEQSVYWTNPETGLLCRCRPDFWNSNGWLIDLKSTADASPLGFVKSVANFRYHVQAAYYTDGCNAKGMAFIAVEKDACVVNGVAKGVGVYVLDEQSLAEGSMEYKKDLTTYAQCMKTGVWSGYSEKIECLTLPRWGFKNESE